MDIKLRILRWEHAIQENPAIIALAIVGTLAAIFIAAMLIDGYLHNRKKKKKRKHR